MSQRPAVRRATVRSCVSYLRRCPVAGTMGRGQVRPSGGRTITDFSPSPARAIVRRPLTPFVDQLPVPARYRVREPARLDVRMEAAGHRFHSELPPSPVWSYDGGVPGPM